jgi:outer membrane protein OmpA-like peptidoglycan-associated protein
MSHLNRRQFFAGVASLAGLAAAGPAFAKDAPTPEAAQGFMNRFANGVKPTYAQRVALQKQEHRLKAIFEGTGVQTFYGKNFTVATLPETALFAHPSTDVRPDAMVYIERLAAEMLGHPDIWLEVWGHWHSDGQAAHAMTMSQRRAVSVQAGLMSRSVPIQRVVASGLGEALPVSSNLTAIGKRDNRRLDLVFRVV